MTLSQTRLPLTLDTPLGADRLLLRRLRGVERISAPFRFHLRMVSDESGLDFAAIVGKSVTATVHRHGGGTRLFNGIVTRFAQGRTRRRETVYTAELRPRLWLLRLSRDCRVFQNQTVPEILEAVLGERQVAFRNALSGSYAAREYCVQYRESTLAFLSRLMEEEGIFYFFEHAAGSHTLVLADGDAAHAPLPDLATARFRRDASAREMDDTVTSLRFEQRVIPGKYVVDDYHFITPASDLMVSVEAEEPLGEIYDYPGRFTTTDDGERIARLRIEACEAPATAARGRSSCRAFTAGYRFDLKGHDRADLDRAWVLRSVRHLASEDGYANRFVAFPFTTPFRPPRRTPRPRVAGAQTAVVVGPSGEEIHTDEYGRVRVKFHWDRRAAGDETSSCWVRVAQGWAGKGWGSFFLPRIGQEVVVSFLDGDPDRPLVTGGVYNATQTVPYPLPDNQTRSTVRGSTSKGGAGSNELRFEDKADAEEVYLHAAKDLTVSVVNDRVQTVDHDEKLTVKNDRTVTVSEGNEVLTVTRGARTVSVDAGDETHTVKGKRTVKVTGDEAHTNEAKFEQETGGNYTLKVTGDLVIEATGSITLKSGTALTAKAGTALTTESGTSLTVKAGTSLKQEAGVSIESKANASQTVETSGVLTLKGSLAKTN